MPDNILFYFVFLSQILLVSFYFPGKILRRIKYVLVTYPPAEYPKLYTKPIEVYEKGMRIFQIINQIILALGFILMFVIGRWDYLSDGSIAEILPFAYWALQVLPLMLMELSGFAYFRLMRKADSRTTRKAELQPRRLFDFISPVIVGLAIFFNIVCILFYFYLDQFHFYWGSDTFVILITLSVSNILYAGIIFWNLRGKKLDPYQAGKDRIRQIEITVKALVFMSIGASIFIMIAGGMDRLDLDYLEPTIMSVYLQFTVLIGLGTMLRRFRIENIDFEVYKQDVSVT